MNNNKTSANKQLLTAPPLFQPESNTLHPIPAQPVMIANLNVNQTDDKKGASIDKQDVAVIFFGFMLLSVLLNWLNPWACQLGGVLLMLTMGIILLIKKSLLPAIVILIGSIGIGLMSFHEANKLNYSLKAIHSNPGK